MLNIISLGAGVQSSTMALMAVKGEITPMPDCAIFADTGGEPEEVYVWLKWLSEQLSYPVYVVKKDGKTLEADELVLHTSKKSGKVYLRGSIPAYVKNQDGTRGILGRKCTADFKIIPIQRKVRELAGIKRAGRGIVFAKMWIGISTDEAHRMKPSRKDYIENTWPIIDKGMSRDDCLSWMVKNGYPEPPRSACRFCPFHSDYEWRRLKEDFPDEWEKAVSFEKSLHGQYQKQNALIGTPYLHNSLVPLSEVELKDTPANLQLNLFGNECEGMCGL